MAIKPAARAEIQRRVPARAAKRGIVFDKMEVAENGTPSGNITLRGALIFLRLFRASALRREFAISIYRRSWEIKASISGTLSISGSGESYTGLFSLDSRGESWRSIKLSGDLNGNLGQARLRLRKGSMLGASITGEVHVVLGKTFSVEGNLRGRGFNPATFLPTWDGEINAGRAWEGSYC